MIFPYTKYWKILSSWILSWNSCTSMWLTGSNPWIICIRYLYHPSLTMQQQNISWWITHHFHSWLYPTPTHECSSILNINTYIPCFKMVSIETYVCEILYHNFKWVKRISRYHHNIFHENPQLMDKFISLASDHCIFVDIFTAE